MDLQEQISKENAVVVAQRYFQIQNKSYHFHIKQYVGKIEVLIGEITSKGRIGQMSLPLDLFTEVIEALKDLENHLSVNHQKIYYNEIGLLKEIKFERNEFTYRISLNKNQYGAFIRMSEMIESSHSIFHIMIPSGGIPEFRYMLLGIRMDYENVEILINRSLMDTKLLSIDDRDIYLGIEHATDDKNLVIVDYTELIKSSIKIPFNAINKLTKILNTYENKMRNTYNQSSQTEDKAETKSSFSNCIIS